MLALAGVIDFFGEALFVGVLAVPVNWNRIRELVLGALSPEELQKSIVYYDEQVLPANTEVEIEKQKTAMPWAGVVAFIDLEPKVNWGHACRYLLVNIETGEIRTIDARFPPFLRGYSDTLRVLRHYGAPPLHNRDFDVY